MFGNLNKYDVIRQVCSVMVNVQTDTSLFKCNLLLKYEKQIQRTTLSEQLQNVLV